MSSEEAKGRYGLKWQFRTVLLIAVFFLTLLLIAGELLVPAFFIQRAEDNSITIASVAAARLDQALRQNAAGAEQLAALPGIVTMDPGQQISIMALAETTNSEIREMFVVNTDGVIIAAVPDHPSYAAGRNFSNAEYFRQPMDTGKPYYSDVFIEGQDVQIIVAAPIKQADGTISGTLNSVLSMTAGTIPEYLKDLAIGKSGYAVVVDRRGSLVWHPDKNRVARQENIRSYQAVKNVVAGESGGELGGLGGDGSITCYVPVKSADFGLLIVRPVSEAFPDITIIRVTVAAVFLAGLILVLIMFWHGLRVVIKPVELITEGIDRFSAGDDSEEVEIEKPREIAELASSLNRMFKLTSTLNDISRTLNSLADLSDIEKFVLNRMDNILKTEASAIIRINKNGQLVIQASRGFTDDMVTAHNLRETDIDGAYYMFGKDAMKRLNKGESILLETDKVKALKTITPTEEIKYVYVFPLVVEKKLNGFLLALSSSDVPFKKERVETVSSLVNQVAGAVQRSDLYEKLYQSYAQTTKAISHAIDAKDPYCQGHSEGVAEIAIKIARKMGLSVDAVRGVEIGAYLHDVGKLGISEELLNKPAQLSEEEREQIKRHPEIGVEILKPIEFPWPVLSAVEHHHERFDGEGYPGGLAGDVIPLEGRILAVADAYESMVSDRPYRSAYDTAEIVKEFTKESGRQFDAGVVAALLDVIGDETARAEELQDMEAGQEPLEGMPEIETVELSTETETEETGETDETEVEGQEILPLGEETGETEEPEETKS